MRLDGSGCLRVSKELSDALHFSGHFHSVTIYLGVDDKHEKGALELGCLFLDGGVIADSFATLLESCSQLIVFFRSDLLVGASLAVVPTGFRSTGARDLFSFEKSVKIFLKFAVGRVSNEDNFAMCIHKQAVGDSLNTVVFVSCRDSITAPVVLYLGPALSRNVIL